MPETTPTHLTEDGSLPNDLDWNADTSVTEHEPPPRAVGRSLKISQDEWEQALYYDGPDFSELIENQSTDTYHADLGEVMIVAYKFSIPRLDEATGQINADATVYAAKEGRSNELHTLFDEVLRTAVIHITMTDDHSRLAVNEFLTQNGLTEASHQDLIARRALCC